MGRKIVQREFGDKVWFLLVLYWLPARAADTFKGISMAYLRPCKNGEASAQ